jgi:hypothetical protein
MRATIKIVNGRYFYQSFIQRDRYMEERDYDEEGKVFYLLTPEIITAFFLLFSGLILDSH